MQDLYNDISSSDSDSDHADQEQSSEPVVKGEEPPTLQRQKSAEEVAALKELYKEEVPEQSEDIERLQKSNKQLEALSSSIQQKLTTWYTQTKSVVEPHTSQAV